MIPPLPGAGHKAKVLGSQVDHLGLWPNTQASTIGAIPFDGDTVAMSNLREIIPKRVMLDTTIVPDCDRMPLPMKSTLEFR